VPVVTETLQVSGIRCERCVNRLAVALRGQDGLESANANLMGVGTRCRAQVFARSLSPDAEYGGALPRFQLGHDNRLR
jgi:hypothetical protein